MLYRLPILHYARANRALLLWAVPVLAFTAVDISAGAGSFYIQFYGLLLAGAVPGHLFVHAQKRRAGL
jgi:hypothetical protein